MSMLRTVAFRAPSLGIKLGGVYGHAGTAETLGNSGIRRAATERPVNDRLTGSRSSHESDILRTRIFR